MSADNHNTSHGHGSHGTMSHELLIGIIMAMAAVQIVVHLVYFLHLNSKAEEGWTLSASILAAIILVIVLAGSLWVMNNMNENMMPMHDMHSERLTNLQSQEG